MANPSQRKSVSNQMYTQQRDLLDAHYVTNRVQQQLNVALEEKATLIKQLDEWKLAHQELKADLDLKMANATKRIEELKRRNSELEVQAKTQQLKSRNLQKSTAQEQTLHHRQFDEYRRNMQAEINRYENQLVEYKVYMAERNQLQAERNTLKEAVQLHKTERIRQVADKERQKIQALDLLQEKMQYKIKAMRVELLSMKKEQLSMSTRLTLQNNLQLNYELEFQSHEAERILLQNEKLRQRSQEDATQLQVQKEMTAQMARRALVAKEAAKKLTEKIEQLQSQLQNQISGTKLSNQMTNQTEGKRVMEQLNGSCQLIQKIGHQLAKNDHQLGQIVEKLNATIQAKDKVEKDYDLHQRQCCLLIKMLLKHYEHIVSEPNQMDSQLLIDLPKLRMIAVEKWSQLEVKVIVELLLNMMKPLLTKDNLNLPSLRKRMKFYESFQMTENGKQNQLTARKLTPRLSYDLNKSAVATQQYINDSSPTMSSPKLLLPLLVNLGSNNSRNLVAGQVRKWGYKLGSPKRGMSINRKYHQQGLSMRG